MPYPELSEKDTWFTKGGSSLLRSSITEINIVNTYEGPSDELWDGSSANDGSIMIHLSGTKLYIVGNGSGKIYANPNSSYAFSDESRVDHYTSVEYINGLSLLDTSRVTDMTCMFRCATKLIELDISNWNTSNVTTMYGMFSGSSSQGSMAFTNLPIGNWDVSNVLDMTGMFNRCTNMSTIPVGNWNMTKCKNIYQMFNSCTGLISIPVGNWDLANCENAAAVFQNCENLTELDVSNWKLSKCKNMNAMFVRCKSLSNIDVSNFDTSSCQTTAAMFYGCESLTSLNVSHFNMQNCTDTSMMFYGCKLIKELDLHTWDVSKVTTMSSMFACPAASGGYGSTGTLESVNLTNWDVSSCTTMSSMFSSQGKLKYVPIETWKGTSACTNMGWMFWTCSSLTSIDLSNFDTSNVVSFHHLFAHGSKLAEIKGLADLDVSSAVTLNAMLHSTRIKTLDVSKWNTSKCNDFSQFVEGCNLLTEIIGLDKFDTSNGKAFSEMFSGCSGLRHLDLSNFSTINADPSWIDPYRNETTFGLNRMLNGLSNLRTISLGKNFSFNGNDNGSYYTQLPVPNKNTIPTTRGVWYNTSTLERYEAADIPNRTAATYSCEPIAVVINNDTLLDVVDTARNLSGSTDKMSVSGAVAKIEEVMSSISSSLDNIISLQEELISGG